MPTAATQLSAANMALKAGDPQLAAYEYEQALLRSDLPDGMRSKAAARLLEAEAAIKRQALESVPWHDERLPWHERLLASETTLLAKFPEPKRRSIVAAAHEPDALPRSRHGFTPLRTSIDEAAPPPSLPLHELEVWQKRALAPSTAAPASAGGAAVSYPWRGVRLASHLREWQVRALQKEMAPP